MSAQDIPYSGTIVLCLIALILIVLGLNSVVRLRNKESHRKASAHNRARDVARKGEWRVTKFTLKPSQGSDQTVVIMPRRDPGPEILVLYFWPEHPSMIKVKELQVGDILLFSCREKALFSNRVAEMENYLEIESVIAVRFTQTQA